jgi:hypothetical protein
MQRRTDFVAGALVAAFAIACNAGEGASMLPPIEEGSGGSTSSGDAGAPGTAMPGVGTGEPFPANTTSGMVDPGPCSAGPLPEPIAGCAPEPLPSTDDPHEDCVRRINQLRAECQCLPMLERWGEVESCADQQAFDDESVATPSAHAGACGESAQLACPDGMGCLQRLWDEGPGGPPGEPTGYDRLATTEPLRVACGLSPYDGSVWFNVNFLP